MAGIRDCRHILVVALSLISTIVSAAELTGKVTSAQGGELLSEVRVSIVGTKLSTTSGLEGTFHLANIPAGSHTLQLSAVGYRTATVPIASLAETESRELLLTLVPDNFHHSETVEVQADLYQAPDWPAIGDVTLTTSELQQTSTVLANDPFRSLQALPGVSASGNDDLLAQFSVMGAPYEQVGIYVDDVLVPNLLHNVPNAPDAPTLSLLTGSEVEDMRLMPVAYPVRYADAIGAALSIRTREGDASPHFHVSLGLADSELATQGRLGGAHKSTWLLGARKSYIGYLIRHFFPETRFSEDGFYDLNLKLTHELTQNQTISLYAAGGETHSNDPHPPTDPNTLKRGTNNLAIARLGWRWSARPTVLVDARVGFVRSGYEEDNPSDLLLQRTLDREPSFGANLSWSEQPGSILQAGYSLRRPHQDFASQTFVGTQPPTLDVFHLSDLRQNFYVQQSLPIWKDRVRVQGGLRWDRLDSERVQPVTGQVSFSLRAARHTMIEAGWGRYAQLPARGGIRSGFSVGGSLVYFSDLPQTSSQYLLAVEQRIGERSRLRAEAFARDNETRFDFYNSALAVLARSALTHRDYSRGVQLVLQRRSENRLFGWVGYTLTYARFRSYQVALPPPLPAIGGDTPYFPTEQDQRHTVNVFGGYRITSSLRCSLKALYGSGFPVSGFPTVIRMDPYARVDLRADKSWTVKKAKVTLYGELLNATNHDNRRFEGYTQLPSGQFVLQTVGSIPITPTAGLAFDF